MRPTIFFVLLLLFASFTVQAQHARHKKHYYVQEVDSLCYRTADTLYFPKGTFSDSMFDAASDSFINNWYSQDLSALHEPVLAQDTMEHEVYRFTSLPSFYHPLAIRIEHQHDVYTLYWKITDGLSDYNPGKLMVDKQKVIEKADWDKFQSLLSQVDFWNIPVTLPVLGADGSDWILEGKTPAKYHVTTRWSPGEHTPYYNCCRFLITLTGMKVSLFE